MPYRGLVPESCLPSFPGSTKIGSCKDRTGKGSTFSTAYKKSLRKFFEVQTSVYEKGNGWIMWTWKVSPGISLCCEGRN